MTTGLDYSAGRIPGRAIRSAGHSFAIRYAGTPGRTKNIKAAEYADLVASGVTVWLVYENGINDAMGGFRGGVAAARAARADADAIGYPNGPIFFCADRHLAPGEVGTALTYLDGAASVLGRESVGAYGFSEFINPARDGGRAAFFWQCGSRSAVRPGVHVYQRNNGTAQVGGIKCDINDLLIPIMKGDDMSANDVIGKRPDGTDITIGDALANLYLGAFYGGGGSGSRAVYATVNAINDDLGKVWDTTGAVTAGGASADMYTRLQKVEGKVDELLAAIRALPAGQDPVPVKP
ncbi:glycoside hydrolase domain-containing protein [Amycolatopsis minnesotensis]|uniref:Rv2525c-like glycoside hydrolase-like domain-containing protein n=1 Tax=Amycolatopsis minnesotensis TaxID=337894 RepID=A0ABN2QGM4_9PSEU